MVRVPRLFLLLLVCMAVALQGCGEGPDPSDRLAELGKDFDRYRSSILKMNAQIESTLVQLERRKSHVERREKRRKVSGSSYLFGLGDGGDSEFWSAEEVGAVREFDCKFLYLSGSEMWMTSEMGPLVQHAKIEDWRSELGKEVSAFDLFYSRLVIPVSGDRPIEHFRWDSSQWFWIPSHYVDYKDTETIAYERSVVPSRLDGIFRPKTFDILSPGVDFTFKDAGIVSGDSVFLQLDWRRKKVIPPRRIPASPGGDPDLLHYIGDPGTMDFYVSSNLILETDQWQLISESPMADMPGHGEALFCFLKERLSP